jgi:hypothetical protein
LSDICAKVLLPDLAQDAGLRTLALIQYTGHEAVFLIADVSDHEQVQPYVKKRDGQGCVVPNHKEVKIGTIKAYSVKQA